MGKRKLKEIYVMPEYNLEKYFRIMDTAQLNYANQYKRLSKNDKRASYIVVYYSIVLIVYALSVHYYPKWFDSTWINYCNTIISIIVLVYSIINSKADYANRASKASESLNKVKGLKRRLGRLKAKPQESPEQKSEWEKEFNVIIEEYSILSSSVEVRDDLDFYYTICSLCKKYGISILGAKANNSEGNPNNEAIKELNGYIAENAPFMQWVHVNVLRIWHLILYLAPILIFLWGFMPFKKLFVKE